jgi:hypothetical protein
MDGWRFDHLARTIAIEGTRGCQLRLRPNLRLDAQGDGGHSPAGDTPGTAIGVPGNGNSASFLECSPRS